jgi:hypothetical protein
MKNSNGIKRALAMVAAVVLLSGVGVAGAEASNYKSKPPKASNYSSNF